MTVILMMMMMMKMMMVVVVLVAVAENVKMDINNPWIKLLLLKNLTYSNFK
jgi:hypothetical protein